MNYYSSAFIINVQDVLVINIITINAAAAALFFLIAGQPLQDPEDPGKEELGCSCQVPVTIVRHLLVRHFI